jgi:hypothetical protein
MFSYKEFYKVLHIYKHIWCNMQIESYLKMKDKHNFMKCFMENNFFCIQHFNEKI